MPKSSKTFLRADGCVVIEGVVTIDGFFPDAPVRIQSHAHKDHLKDFDRSKGAQEKIVLSQKTLELLVAEFNGDIPVRKRQFCPLQNDGNFKSILNGVEIALYTCGHLLGSSMTEVRMENGKTYVCASDFSWPIANLPQNPEILIVDATYGDPAGIRNYNRDEVEDKFCQLLADKSREGPILIRGHRGRLESAIQTCKALINAPIIYSERVSQTFGVFEKHYGFEANGVVFGSREFREIIQSGDRYTAFCYHFESKYIDQLNPKNKITLSAYMVPKQEPILEHAAGVIRVALTDHADFKETIELIKLVSPKKVIADGTRGGNADALANFVSKELKIEATARAVPTSPEWGHH